MSIRDGVITSKICHRFLSFQMFDQKLEWNLWSFSTRQLRRSCQLVLIFFCLILSDSKASWDSTRALFLICYVSSLHVQSRLLYTSTWSTSFIPRWCFSPIDFSTVFSSQAVHIVLRYHLFFILLFHAAFLSPSLIIRTSRRVVLAMLLCTILLILGF